LPSGSVRCRPTSGRHVQAVHGPEHLTYQDAASIVAEATGRRLRVEGIPDDEMRTALQAAGMGRALVEVIMETSPGRRDEFVPEDPRSVLTTTPTTIASWAHEHLRDTAPHP
jgi:uncharacterized protein YbjT (DUF2867 family)